MAGDGPGAKFCDVGGSEGLTPLRGNLVIRRKAKSAEKKRVLSYLLELLDGTLVDSTALVDQMACMYL